ncbi:MAG: hypothetical protein U1E47_01610 [Rivihabitans pingtungensis]
MSAQFCLHAAPMKDLSARTLAVCGGGAIGEALAAGSGAGHAVDARGAQGRGAGARGLYPV